MTGRSQSKSEIGTGRARLCAYVKLSTLNSAIDPDLRDRKVEDSVRYENCACRAPEKRVRSCGGARMGKAVSSRERLVRDTHQLLPEG